MSITATKTMLRISEPDPFGDVTLVPKQISGHCDADLARAMADALIGANPESHSDALKILRVMFPGSPLTVRVAALGAMLRR